MLSNASFCMNTDKQIQITSNGGATKSHVIIHGLLTHLLNPLPQRFWHKSHCELLMHYHPSGLKGKNRTWGEREDKLFHILRLYDCKYDIPELYTSSKLYWRSQDRCTFYSGFKLTNDQTYVISRVDKPKTKKFEVVCEFLESNDLISHFPMPLS